MFVYWILLYWFLITEQSCRLEKGYILRLRIYLNIFVIPMQCDNLIIFPHSTLLFFAISFLHLKSFLKGRFLSGAKLFNCLLVRKLTLNEVSDNQINANRPKYLNFWTKLKQEIKVKPFKLCKLTRFLKVSDFLKCNNNTYYLNTTNKKAYFYDITYFFKTVTI